MPLILNKKLADNAKLSLWQISETEDFFLSYLQLPNDKLAELEPIKNKSRRLEWLCVRYLLKHMLKSQATIIYNKHRKPFIENSNLNISISHSKNTVAIILHPNSIVGIDIETISDKLEKIKHRFLNIDELKSLQKVDIKKSLMLYWCAKETILKIHGKKDIDFRNQISIKPFIAKEKGEICGIFSIGNKKNKISLKYFYYNDMTIMYGNNNIINQ